MFAVVRQRGLSGLEDDIIPSRSDINAAGKELQGRVKALASEITSFIVDNPSQTTPADFQTGEQAFLVAWNSFVTDFTEWDPDNTEWYIDRWKRRADVLAFRTRFNSLQEWFTSLGAFDSTPKYKPSELPSSSPWPTLARYAIYALVAGVVVYGGVQLYTVAKTSGMLRLRTNPTRKKVRRRRRRKVYDPYYCPYGRPHPGGRPCSACTDS